MNTEEEKYMADFFPDWKNWRKEFQAWRVQSRKPNGNTVVFIPARSGSTRIKDKNIYPLCGKPLIAYTIEVAKALYGVDRIIVSTDSPRYAAIAGDFGAEAPVLRPKELAGATSRFKDAYYHLLFALASTGYQVSTIVTLLPTSLFRNVVRIQEMVDMTKRYGVCQSVFRPQVVRYSASPANDGCIPFKSIGLFSGRNVSQVNIHRTKLFFTNNPFELVDIDTQEDLDMARLILEKGLFDFGIIQ